MRHTPGPWFVTAGGNVESVSGGYVANCCSMADAGLIAAAPSMHYALLSILLAAETNVLGAECLAYIVHLARGAISPRLKPSAES